MLGVLLLSFLEIDDLIFQSSELGVHSKRAIHIQHSSILLLFKRRKPLVYAQWARTVRVPIFTCVTCRSMIQVQGVLTGTAVRLLSAVQLIHGGILVMLLCNLGTGEMQVMVDHFKGGVTQYPPQREYVAAVQQVAGGKGVAAQMCV